MKINIEEKSGFCYGVNKVVEMAETILDRGEPLYCLGQIVHNEMEIKRLESKGLRTINMEEFMKLHNCSVLVRAHGEPPSTYQYARENVIKLIDGTCPIVHKIQTAIAERAAENDSLIVIFGKKDHPEVEGLFGQAPGKSKIIKSSDEVALLPKSPVVHLFSQTTMDSEAFRKIIDATGEKQNNEGGKLIVHNTICGHVSHRRPGLQKFASENDVLLFVGGTHSSNGKVLFEVCRAANPNTFYISSPDEIQTSWFKGFESVGITGATSTPRWQIEKVADKIKELILA